MIVISLLLSLCFTQSCIHAGFAADTLVALSSGEYRPISQCNQHDELQTQTGSDIVALRGHGQKSAVTIHTSVGDVTCSPDQHLFVQDCVESVPAIQLQPGDRLCSTYNFEIEVVEVEELAESVDLYDITIQSDHTLYVTQYNILVHNCLVAEIPYFIGCGTGIVAAGTLPVSLVFCGAILTLFQFDYFCNVIDSFDVYINCGASDYDLLWVEQEGAYTWCGTTYTWYDFNLSQQRMLQDAYDQLYGIQQPYAFYVENSNNNDAAFQEHVYEDGVVRKYKDNPKHGKKQKGNISPRPDDGEEALRNSVPVEGSTQRIAVQGKDFVILKETSTICGEKEYHGYKVEWDDLYEDQKRALEDAGLVRGKGKIIKK